MYEELLIGLRGHAKRHGCDDRCPCYDAEDRGYTTCSEELAEKAADAIEELSKRIDRAVELYNRGVERGAMYEVLVGIAPEPPKEERIWTR